MNLFQTVKSQILNLLRQMQAQGDLPGELSLDAVDVMPPRETRHGDMATNAPMVLAAKAGKKPKELAELLSARLRELLQMESVEIAGPGFINMRFAPAFWQKIVAGILEEGKGYGNSHIGNGRKVNVEYVSANPTGPMHVGHGRGAVVGDALALLLMKSGFNVTKEYYINDAGAQVDRLAESAYLRYREALGETITEIPEGLYPGDYLVAVGEALAREYGRKWLDKPQADWLPLFRNFTIDCMMALIREDLLQLGIEHDVFTSERALRDGGKVDEAVRLLEEKGLIYSGVLEPPKGKPVPEDWEPKPQLLFRSSQFGDDSDRPVKKSDGSWAYFTPDIAYHLDKYQRGFKDMILILGADHVGYQKRLKAAAKALSDGKVNLETKLCQLVRFLRAGEPVKMSKRKGTFMTVREVVDEVGNGVFRFIMLTRKNDASLDFDFVKVTEQSKDNPVFYVQYAHARAQSVLRLARQEMGVGPSVKPEDLALLTHPAELELLRLMAGFPRLVEQAALAFEPHRIAFYLQELASSFHALWNLGNSEISLRFIQKDAITLTAARMAMVSACATVIASGLLVLGVEPMEEMR